MPDPFVSGNWEGLARASYCTSDEMNWHPLPRRPPVPAEQTITMQDLLDRRSSDTAKDMESVPPNWAQPQHQTRTKSLLTAVVAASYWKNKKLDETSFGDLVVILLPDHCCDKTHILYARAVNDLDPFLHEMLLHLAATVWDTLQHADSLR